MQGAASILVIHVKTNSARGGRAVTSEVQCDGHCQLIFKVLQKEVDLGVYHNKTVGAATIDNEEYITYGLASSVEGCLTPCDQTGGCVFVNVYQDHVDEYPADVADLPESA